MFASIVGKLEVTLAALGRFGTQAFVVAIVLGLIVPSVASALRPLLPVTLFLFLAIMFARADFSPIAATLRRPARLAGACLWLIAAPLVLVAAAIALIKAAGLADPGLILALAVMGAAPPIISSPAIALLYGFEPSLIIASVVAVTGVTPFIAPPIAEWLAGAAVPIDRNILMLRLVILVGGGIAAGLAVRFTAGRARIDRARVALDGTSVILFGIFATAAMDGVNRAAWERPLVVLAFLALAFTLSLIGFLITMPALRFLKPPDRFMLGYGTGQRNMGLLIAALGAGTPDTTYLFFALAQIPIFLMPQILRPLATRIARRGAPPPIV